MKFTDRWVTFLYAHSRSSNRKMLKEKNRLRITYLLVTMIPPDLYTTELFSSRSTSTDTPTVSPHCSNRLISGCLLTSRQCIQAGFPYFQNKPMKSQAIPIPQ